MNNQLLTIPSVDLVIVIDTSPSMKDEAEALSKAAEAAIEAARSSCPSDLRVIWFGIEGTWRDTKFDRTIRDYLKYVCNIPESRLRGRKRGEVAEAGAQEDGARAIEDLSKHFDWRVGAKRSIFYLGDEALEGGGSKTDKEDIKAANLAIQTAKQSTVTVHTYFGTSKSKHQQGIQDEYKRIAQETGGQAFSDKDTINGFTAVLEKVICSSPRQTPTSTQLNTVLTAGTAYVQDCVIDRRSNLYTLDLSTAKATFIGAIATEVTDIAFVGSELYGLDQKDIGKNTQLIKIDPHNGKTTVIGDIGFYVIGLAYNLHRNTLYATTAKQLVALNINTGAGTPVVTVANQDYNCGEVAFNGNDTYITLIGYDKKKILASCNLDTGTVTHIGDIGFANITSMEFYDGVLYGVTGNFFSLGTDGQLVRINTITGAGTLIKITDPIGRWAGITIYQGKTQSIQRQPSEPKVDKYPRPQPLPTKVNNMSFLTIDSKDNCYVINQGQMNDLQERVAKSVELERGNYTIRIESGRYNYALARTEGEPFVLLWIYGINGSTFINKNTGFETGATWTTLNGYQDSLKLEVKEKVSVCALFLDIENTNNSGGVTVSIRNDNSSLSPLSLPVDSKQNSYLLDEGYLTTVKKWGYNYKELQPGKYKIKIREGKFGYWSENQKFDLEPWALIWVKGGKIITKQTGVEVEQTWLSLNGYNDQVVLEVKETTTLCGLFFDTYKEDNQGSVTLAIEPIITAIAQPSYDYLNIGFDSFARNPQTDIVCVAPVRSIIRREEEITIIRRVRKVEEIDASPACPVNTTQINGQ